MALEGTGNVLAFGIEQGVSGEENNQIFNHITCAWW